VSPNLRLEALQVLIEISISYLFELGFASLVKFKSKEKERLKVVDDEMLVCLFQICPDIQDICRRHQSHVSL
jgi:hypothetical protein